MMMSHSCHDFIKPLYSFIYLSVFFFLWFSKKYSFSVGKSNVLLSAPHETGKAFNYGSVNSKRAHLGKLRDVNFD